MPILRRANARVVQIKHKPTRGDQSANFLTYCFFSLNPKFTPAKSQPSNQEASNLLNKRICIPPQDGSQCKRSCQIKHKPAWRPKLLISMPLTFSLNPKFAHEIPTPLESGVQPPQIKRINSLPQDQCKRSVQIQTQTYAWRPNC
jgi:hypothetical protein